MVYLVSSTISYALQQAIIVTQRYSRHRGGIGQVMGYHWKALGYPSLQQFINDMYHSEAKQLEAMIRYIKVNNLVDELQRHDWAGFARGYNGAGYKRNNYDEKLRQAYNKYK